MEFLKEFLRNLLLLGVVILFLYIASPDMIGQAFQLLGMLFGPVMLILLIIISALPKKSGRRRR